VTQRDASDLQKPSHVFAPLRIGRGLTQLEGPALDVDSRCLRDCAKVRREPGGRGLELAVGVAAGDLLDELDGTNTDSTKPKGHFGRVFDVRGRENRQRSHGRAFIASVVYLPTQRLTRHAITISVKSIQTALL